MLYRLSIYLILPLCLIACSNQNVTVKYQNKFDFSLVKTYRLFDRNSAYGSFQNLPDPLRNMIELSIEQKIDRKGYIYNESDNVDIVVAYYLVSYSNKALWDYSKGVKYCDYCLTSGTSANKGRIDLSPGNLLIDLLDAKDMKSIWRASAPIDFDPDDAVYEQQEKLNEVIGNMFGNLNDKS